MIDRTSQQTGFVGRFDNGASNEANQHLASLIVTEVSKIVKLPVRFLGLSEADCELLVEAQSLAQANAKPHEDNVLTDVLLARLPWRWQPETIEVTLANETITVVDDPARVEFLERFHALPSGSVAVVVTGLSFLARRETNSSAALLMKLGAQIVAAVPIPRGWGASPSSSGQFIVIMLRGGSHDADAHSATYDVSGAAS